MIDPGPNAANRRPAGVAAVIAPARCAAPQARCTSRHASVRPPLARASMPGMDDYGTRPLICSV
jgi:hypothetical protein